MSNTIKNAINGTFNGSKRNGGKKLPPPTNISKTIHGKVKWFDVRKGIGFITADDGSEHFIYHSHIAVGRNYTGFEAGDEVNYRVQIDPNTNRQQAVNAMLVINDSDFDNDNQNIDNVNNDSDDDNNTSSEPEDEDNENSNDNEINR